MGMPQLRDAEKNFYKVGLSRRQCLAALDEATENLSSLARSILAHIISRISGDSKLRFDAGLLLGLNVLEPIQTIQDLMRLSRVASGKPIDCKTWNTGMAIWSEFDRRY